MKIYLSPSNQNGNLYSAGGTNEMVQCNRIADAAREHLTRNGYDVKKAPQGQDMYKSIDESNQWGADLHLPIHTNAGGGAGTVVFVYNTAAKNMKYAQAIYDAVQAVSPGTVDYGIRTKPGLAEINATRAIAVYIECEFHDNATLAQWIIDNTDTIGQAIARGVCASDGKAYIEPAEPVVPDVFYRVLIQDSSYAVKENAEKRKAELEKSGNIVKIEEFKR